MYAFSITSGGFVVLSRADANPNPYSTTAQAAKDRRVQKFWAVALEVPAVPESGLDQVSKLGDVDAR